MKNQTNVGNQNTQQIDKNLINQPVQIPVKPKVNYWMISSMVLVVGLVLISGLYFINLKSTSNFNNQQSAQPNSTTSTKQTIHTLPTSPAAQDVIMIPEKNTLYLGTYNSTDAV